MTHASPPRQLRTLAATAVLGTDRAGGVTPGSLLDQAALLGAQSRAGFKPSTAASPTGECPPDPRDAAPPPAMATLYRLLAEPDAGLIEEWATLARSARRRVAEPAVPLVLDWWARQPTRCDAVFLALGTVGEWLAALNPDWRRPVITDTIPADLNETWHTGTSAERLAALRAVRRLDPARGLTLVESSWASDGADERRKALEALAEQLSAADEPFLERALDDRSVVVRRQAASLLRTLPGSRLRARLTALAATLLDLPTTPAKRGSRTGLALSPPGAFDPAWARDGIEEQAGPGVGPRAWWMRQILASSDLSAWTDRTGLAPDDLVSALAKDPYFDDAIQGLLLAAETSCDPPWCAALAKSLLARNKIATEHLAPLCRGLPPTQREPVLLGLAGHDRLAPIDRWDLLARTDGPWSGPFTRRALEALTPRRPSKSADTWRWSELIDRVSRLIDPAHADAFEASVRGLFGEDPTGSIQRSLDRARLRAEMHKEFAP